MIKLMLVLILILNFDVAFSESYRAVSLYESGAMVTGRFLPFKVYDSQNTPINLKKIEVNQNCQSMIDPYKTSIFHIYCLDEVNASVKVMLTTNEVIYIEDIPIKKLSIIDPRLPDDNPVVESMGKKLFVNNCIRCHNSQPISKPQTAASVRAAFLKEPMKSAGLDLLFSSDQEKIDALVKYINEEF